MIYQHVVNLFEEFASKNFLKYQCKNIKGNYLVSYLPEQINLSLCLHMYMLGNENECGRTFASRKVGVTSKINKCTENNWEKMGKNYLFKGVREILKHKAWMG